MNTEEKPEQEPEPVAWQERQETAAGTFGGWYMCEKPSRSAVIGPHQNLSEWISGINYQWRSLYTQPPLRKPLTDAEIYEVCGLGAVDIEFVRIVEKAHGIGVEE
jgi:hypothetical protein